MKKIYFFVLIAGICFGIFTDASAKVRLWEVRAMVGMSMTTINKVSVVPLDDNYSTILKPNEKDVAGVPVGLRFVIASSDVGLAFNINTYFQPVITEDENTEYLVTSSVWAAGRVEPSFWEAGISGEFTYRFAKPLRGLYVGAGVGLHRVNEAHKFNPPVFFATDYPFGLDEIDNSDFRSGIHVLVGIPIHPRFAIEARYEKINDFEQYKIGISAGLWIFKK